MSGSPNPILVTGSHRSGTTWVGQMLTLSGEVASLHEPFNPDNHRSWLEPPPQRWFTHVDETNAEMFRAPMDRVLRMRPPVVPLLRRSRSARDVAAVGRELARAVRWRADGRRILLKDPIAFFAAPWLAETYSTSVVVLVRHPAAFVSSLVRLGWAFDFGEWTSQPRLMEGPLVRFRDEIEAAASSPPELLEQGILLWRCINDVARTYRDERGWRVIRYEDLAADPLGTFPGLYRELGLSWTQDTVAAARPFVESERGGETPAHDPMNVRRDSSASRFTWLDRLDRDQVAAIRRGTSDVAEAFYGPDDWRPDHHQTDT